MKFYHIKDDFISFLRQYDSKVSENKNQTRPYVGVVLEINSIKYYAPFSSPKPKHKKMKNGKDFRKINNGIYGAINFNNMIPVLDEVLIKMVEKDRYVDRQFLEVRQPKDVIFYSPLYDKSKSFLCKRKSSIFK